MESVDKFGRPLFSGGGGGDRSVGLRGPKGEGFVLDNRGNYLVSHKLIKQLGDPEEDQDAVNKRWLEPRIASLESRITSMDEKLLSFKVTTENAQHLGSYAMEQSQKAYDRLTAVNLILGDLSSKISALMMDAENARSLSKGSTSRRR